MKFYTLEPGVAGVWGNEVKADTSSHPPHVTQLHINLDGPMRDGIGESFPCFYIHNAVADALLASTLSGFECAEMSVSGAQDKLVWLKIFGRAGYDDFGVNEEHILVVSNSALDLLKPFGLDDADIELVC